eukprot:11132850-Alexandrium_andersonii.AAC.1
MDRWRAAVVISPFRPAGVVARWPYLGISAGCRATEGRAGLGRWEAAEYRRVVSATWSKAIAKLQARSNTLAANVLSAGRRAR